MSKGIDEKINRGESWDNYTGDRVQEYVEEQLDQRIGWIHRPQEPDEDGQYHALCFATKEDYQNWNDDPEGNASLMIQDLVLPASGGGGGGGTGLYYRVNLLTNSPSSIITTDNTIKLQIRFVSEEVDSATQTAQPTLETGTLTIQTRINNNSTWVNKGTITNIPSYDANSSAWTEIDITRYVGTGSFQVRIIAEGDFTHVSSRFLQFEITNTNLSLRFATQWEKPVTDGVMRLQYYVQGAVSKTLHLLIDGQRSAERNVGTAVYTETPLQIDITDTDRDSVKALSHGIHEIEAWLSVNDSDVESEHIRCQVMVVADVSDTTPRLILNSVATRLTNWTAENILEYALHNPSGEAMPLKFILQDYRGTEQYMTLDAGNVEPGVRHALSNIVEIESDQPQIEAYMKFLSGEKEIHDMISFEVDNSENYSPTADPDFILNPRMRTNQEDNPLSIVNHATGQSVPSTWKGFGLVADGWQEDSEGNRCLRVPAGRGLEIDYETFTGYIGTDNRSSLTVEIEIASRNATSMDEPIVRMCSYLGGDARQSLGFEMRPTQCAMLTRDKREYDDQDAACQEGVRTHIALNIIHGINGTDLNYVRIFVNGIINREFLWETADEFVQYVGSTRTSQGIRIGSPDCDTDIYGIRIYKRALSASDVMKDYEATLPTIERKQTFRRANDILDDSNRISYAKTREQYNTLLVTGDVPSYSTGNVKMTCDLEIETLGDPEHSGKINDMEISGQGTSSRSYWKWNFQFKFKDASRFVNALGDDLGGAFALDETVSAATKLVAKLNWASSQQSHKMGSCNLFTELWRRCTGGSSITRTPGFEKCRPTVKQKPYFLFVRKSEAEEPQFYGLYTFGPGKGDKATFGYDKKVFPWYLMIEGCDNGEPLTNHRIPWNADISIGGDEDELVQYSGRKQWEIDLGAVTEPDSSLMGEAAVKDGAKTNLDIFRSAFNFVYLHSPHIEPYIGTLEDLQVDQEVNRQHFYWVTQASGETKRYDLFRHDELSGQWVDAGVEKLGAGKYARLNLAEQLGHTPSGVMWDKVNQEFIDLRVKEFAEQASEHFALNDAYFCMMFLKLIGASDNRAKNTYMYLAEVDGKLRIHFAQDDLDTIFSTDNVGRKNKPYYVEEHDRDADGGTYWNGEENALYDLMEMAFPGELRAMMKSILTEMANLASDHTPLGCIDDFYFSTQRYFPAVAYNETARLLYEEAAQKWATGEYTASTHPLTQSLGDQLQGETQWMRQRITYMSSFCSYGPFAMNGEGSLTWRSATETTGRAPEYTFELTPRIWLYPAVSAGSSTVYGKGNAYPQRVKAGETFTLAGVAADNDTNIQLHGIHHYSKIGQFGDKSLTGSFTVAGDRLTEFRASAQPMEFRPTSVIVTAPLLRVFDIKGASTVGGSINFSMQDRLEEIDLRGTSISSFAVAEPTAVKTLRLPATLTSLTLKGYTALTQEGFEIEGASRVQSFVFSNCPYLNSQQIVAEMLSAEDNDIHEISVEGIDWKAFSTAHLLKLAEVGANLRGRIALATAPTFEEKRRLLEAFGDIDSEDNALHVTYTKVYLTSVELTGDSYYGEPGEYRLSIIPSSTRANDFTKLEWKMTASSYASIDPQTGIITVSRVGTAEGKPSATVTLEVTTSDGTSAASSMEIWFYTHECEVLDLVYHDGTFSDKWDKTKTVVGICFYIDPANKDRRLMISTHLLSTGCCFGLSNSGNGLGVPGITPQDSPGYDVYNTPLPDISLYTIRETTPENYLDATTPDGFKRFSINDAPGNIGFMQLQENFSFKNRVWEAGEYIPLSLYNTLILIQHRNRICQDSSVQLQTPSATSQQTETQNLDSLMQAVAVKEGENYKEFYYPAASYCHAYEPSAIGLRECFKAGNWALPAIGDILRFEWYVKRQLEGEPEGRKLREWMDLGIISNADADPLWSSSEINTNTAWNIYGRALSSINGYALKYASNNKVFAVCAF